MWEGRGGGGLDGGRGEGDLGDLRVHRALGGDLVLHRTWQVEQQQQFDEQEKRCPRPTDKAYPRQYCKHIAATIANLAKLLQDEPALFLNLVGMRRSH